MPLKIRKSRASPPWLTREAKRKCEAKRRHFKKYLKTRTTQDFNQYKSSEKKCKKAILKAKKGYERRIASADDRNLFASYVKSKCKSKDSVGPLKAGNSLTNDPKEMCEILNNFFASVFTIDNSQPRNDYPDKSKGCSLLDVYISREKVLETIGNLRPSTSKDFNGITNRFIKDFRYELAGPLTKLFQWSINTGNVPNDWKLANVVPIFKKGQKSDPSNYRPVSLTSIVCKIFERVLQKSIMSHLEVNKLLNESQHGFRSKKSCATNLLEFLEYATSRIDEGEPVDIVYYDFAKAFDKVSTHKLLLKLKAYGIRGKVYRWIESWLANRKQRTTLGSEFSDWIDVISGVPQGSVLGPLLFIIFIDDIDTCAVEIDKCAKFADDTKTANLAKTIENREKLQVCINKMFDWSQEWSMSFNIPKCKVMHLGYNNPRADYVMNGLKLEKVNSEKDIGVSVASSLKTGDHCVKAAGTAMSVLFQLLRTFHFRDRVTFVKLYKTYVRPHLEFSVAVWSPCLQKDIEVLEKVQRKFIRNVSGLHAISYESKLVEIGLLSLSDRRVYLELVETFKIIKGFTNIDRPALFELYGDTQRRFTRVTECPINIVPKRSNLDIRRHFYTNRIVSNWNALPNDMKLLDSLICFKKSLKSHLISIRSVEIGN